MNEHKTPWGPTGPGVTRTKAAPQVRPVAGQGHASVRTIALKDVDPRRVRDHSPGDPPPRKAEAGQVLLRMVLALAALALFLIGALAQTTNAPSTRSLSASGGTTNAPVLNTNLSQSGTTTNPSGPISVQGNSYTNAVIVIQTNLFFATNWFAASSNQNGVITSNQFVKLQVSPGMRANACRKPPLIYEEDGWSTDRGLDLVHMAQGMAALGFVKAGYTICHKDIGLWSTNRTAGGALTNDAWWFPEGVPWLISSLATNGVRLGTYLTGPNSPGQSVGGSPTDNLAGQAASDLSTAYNDGYQLQQLGVKWVKFDRTKQRGAREQHECVRLFH